MNKEDGIEWWIAQQELEDAPSEVVDEYYEVRTMNDLRGALNHILLLARDARSLLQEDEYPWYELKEIEELAERELGYNKQQRKH